MNHSMQMVGYVVTTLGAATALVILFWLALEAMLSVEDRVLEILRVQPAMLHYLRNANLYEKLMREHKAKLLNEGRGEPIQETQPHD
jgi:hypothetical protein